ncbi:MAG: anaerobic ribonucleoside-triphosphate reductase activating protein [Eubacterium sp.]|nr:anaerobic ribonucleoside-triphosphate reductase activating protein [Eubacterium sp.]SEG37904.1 anaerobic ribonucleoside-triphosphate reductase activating protein [Eubacterium ruminantium]
MNCCGIYYCDTANGVGIRTSLYVSGCTHHCKGCFNEQTWDFSFGKLFTPEIADEIINSLKRPYVQGLTILGGEPWEVSNQRVLRPFVEKCKKECPDKTIWTYSGYLFEELTDPDNHRCHSEDTLPMLSLTDVLVDGEFVLARKNLKLRFRGSDNQRIINVPESLKKGEVVLSEYMEK